MATLRVGVIGRGAIGNVIARHLAADRVEGAVLAGVLRRSASRTEEVEGLDDLLSRDCDMVIEAAGHDALRAYAVGVLEAGKDLVVLSAGALADPATEARLRAAGPGRMLISTGAIGGLDIARAMLEAGNLEDISIRSTTTPAALSDVGTVPQVTAEDGPTLVLAGTARDVALRFPRVANVAATVALATLGLDVVRAELWVDPIGTRKRHELAATAGDSRLDVRIENNLSEDNPRTGAVTPYAVLRLLGDLTRPFTAGV